MNLVLYIKECAVEFTNVFFVESRNRMTGHNTAERQKQHVSNTAETTFISISAIDSK